MSNRRDDLLDAAIIVLGEGGVRGVTHKAVDVAAGLPAGSTSNYFRTKDALLTAVVERFAARERANWEEIAAATVPTTPTELARALAAFAHDAVGPHRTLTLARYARHRERWTAARLASEYRPRDLGDGRVEYNALALGAARELGEEEDGYITDDGDGMRVWIEDDAYEMLADD